MTPLLKRRRHRGRFLAKLPPDPEHDPHWIEDKERERLKRFAREKGLWVGRNFRKPVPDPDLSSILALWTWRKPSERKPPGWILLGFRRIHMTKKRVRKWRRQVGIRKGEMLLIATLAGGPPTRAPFVYNPVYSPRPKWGRRKVGKRGKTAVADRLRPVTDPFGQGALPTTARQVTAALKRWEVSMAKLRKNEARYNAGLAAFLPKRQHDCTECPEPGNWLVGFTYRGRRRIVPRCTRHAWQDEDFPETAKAIVRVYRSVLPQKKRRRST